MNLPNTREERLAGFPPALRALLDAELAAGNTIVEVESTFPAPPAGAYVLLANPVTTRPRASGDGVVFYDRNSSSYSGEFTDAKRFHFILEPPRPPEPEPDMDAIRAQLQARYAESCRIEAEKAADGPRVAYFPGDLTPAERAIRSRVPPDPNSAVARFEASMCIDYEKWHDGIGYDLEILKTANPEELKAIEELLIRRHPRDWRDVEALAALGSKKARAALKDSLHDRSAEVRMAVHRHAPEVLTKQQRTDSIVEALQTADFYGGLSQALDEAAEFHPPEVERALLRGLMERDGSVAYHLATTLYAIHGKIPSRHDMERRPFFLRFNTPDLAEREKAVRELCAELGLDPHRAIKPRRAK